MTLVYLRTFMYLSIIYLCTFMFIIAIWVSIPLSLFEVKQKFTSFFFSLSLLISSEIQQTNGVAGHTARKDKPHVPLGPTQFQDFTRETFLGL